MKKMLGLFLAVVVMASGCGKGQLDLAEPAAEGAALKIAIVSSPSGVDDGSFNQDNYNGILRFIERNPASTVTPVREESGGTAASVQAAADIAGDYDVIVCCGFQFAGIGTVAADNPDVKFILVDAYPTNAAGEETELENLYAMKFAEQESGFFAGMAAALETKSNKVAVVTGIAFPSNINYQLGFECGVNYVNAAEGREVECVELPSYAGTDVTGANVGGNYVGTFSDEAAGKVVGKALIDAGCDVMLVAAGSSGNGIFTAAKEAGDIYLVGCDVDQYGDGVNGNSNIILTSVLKVMHLGVETALDRAADGTFQGGNVLLQAGSGFTGYVKAEGRHQLSPETIAKMDTAYGLVAQGTILPASHSNAMTPENFEGLPK